MSDYYKYKESHLKAQKKWKENNQDKVKDYERKRYEKRKQLKQENETLKADLQEANDNAEWWHNRYNTIVRQLDQLTNNWNELEELINNRLHTITMHPYMIQSYEYILNKMKEIKERKNEII